MDGALPFDQAAPDEHASPDLAPTIIAHDDFNRADQALWGVASDGQTWGGDANASASFSIPARSGRSRAANTTANAVLADESTSVTTVTVSSFTATRL